VVGIAAEPVGGVAKHTLAAGGARMMPLRG
jgi:hypothetical protein